jgi:hypothetical protein
MQTVYQKLLAEAQGKEFKKIEDSRRWFREVALKVAKSKISAIDVIKEKTAINNLNPTKSQLLLYNYIPRTKEKLPYYDIFPIVFPFKIEKDGFYGFNLHYLPPVMRAALMDTIYGTIGGGSSRITYNMSSRSKLFKVCVKKYLISQIKSKIVAVPQNEWDLVLFLPLQKFQKEAEATVWNDSIKKIKRK